MTISYLVQPPTSASETDLLERREALAVAVAWRKIIWRQAARDEDERIDRLTDVCTRLCDGDLDAGRRLATKAIWSAA
jgi:hypothetical protein